MLNKVILIGRAGKEPEIRSTQTGEMIANLTIATGEKYKNKQGEKVETTEWHNVVFFGRIAEIVKLYIHKGDLLYIEGKIKTEKYTNKQGQDVYSTKIYGKSLQMLGTKSMSRQPQETPQNAISATENAFEQFTPDDLPF